MSKKPSKRKQKAHKEQAQDDLVQVDAFMIPAPFAAMYQVLREAVAEDLLALLSQEFARVARAMRKKGRQWSPMMRPTSNSYGFTSIQAIFLRPRRRGTSINWINLWTTSARRRGNDKKGGKSISHPFICVQN